MLFGTPSAEPHQAEGFFKWSGGAGDRFVWARREVEVALRFESRAARSAVVDLRAFEGVKDQAADVLLNGKRVERVEIPSGRQRVLLWLPAALQRIGENRLRFEFAATSSAAAVDPRSSDGGRLAAAFSSLVVAPEGDPKLIDLLGRDSPRPFSQGEDGGVPQLVQMGPASLARAIRLPPAAELRFTPELHAAARARDGRAHLSVSIESPGGRERELWSATLTAREASPGEVALRLPGVAGEPMRVTLRVAGGRAAWALWRAPRVIGRPGPSPGRALERERKSAALGQALAGKSVVLVILDAARARQLGCYGYPRATTPELDLIAREGVVFENAFTPAVYTVGAMSSVWTSQQPDQHHGETSFEARLPKDRLTLAELLQAQGVHTAGFVANAMAGRALGFERGFQEFHELLNDPELGSRAELMRRPLGSWLERNRGRRFFLYVHFREPHFPYDPPPEFRARFGEDAPLPAEASRDRAWYVAANQGALRPTPAELAHLTRLYDGNLAYVDRELGLLRRALEASGLWDEVALLVTADHGEQLYEHDYISHSAQVYEDSMRVPLILRLPRGSARAGERVSELVDLTDVAPTIADAFGVLGKGGSDREFDGKSLLGVLAGGSGREAVVSRSVWERPLYAIRSADSKLIRNLRSGAEELYDLGSDPLERRNVLAEQPILASHLRQELFAFAARVRSRPAGAGEPPQLTRDQCDNLRALQYDHTGCK